MNNSRLLSYLGIMSCVGITSGMILISAHPISGYVVSVYSSISPIIKLNIVLFSMLSLAFIYHYAKLNTFQKSAFLIIMALNSSIILLFPYIRGIIITNAGDTLEHVGRTLDIIVTGKINFNVNFYPALHIVSATLSLITNISPVKVIGFFGPMFSLVLYPIFILAFSKLVNSNKFAVSLSVVLALTFPLNYFNSLYNSFTVPNGISYMILPLYFYVLFYVISKRTLKTIYIYLPLISTISIFHPLVNTLILSSLFVAVVLLYIKLEPSRYDWNILLSSLVVHALIYISYIVYLTTVWKSPINSLKRFLLGIRIVERTADIVNKISKLGLTYFEIFRLTFKTSGHLLILFTFTLLAILYIVISSQKDYTRHNNSIYTWYSVILGFYLVNIILFGIQLLSPSVFNVAYYRFFLAMMALSPSLAILYISNKFKKSFKITTSVVIIISFLISSMIAYPSPYSLRIGSQLTKSDATEAMFIFSHRPSHIRVYGYLTRGTVGRFFSLLQPFREYKASQWSTWKSDNFQLPNHFGYSSNNTFLSNQIMVGSFIVISVRDFFAYTTVWRAVGRLDWSDMNKINLDPTVNLIYNTGENLAYWVS